MMALFAGRWITRFAVVALLAIAVLAPGCGRPPDETWLRFLGFREKGTTKTLALLEGKLLDGTSSVADAAFRNDSLLAGAAGSGTGILIYRARIDYGLLGFAPPAADLPLHLYIPAPVAATATAAASGGTETLSAFPLASTSLKYWIIATDAAAPVVELTAFVTFFGVTDEGRELQTTGGIAIALSNP